MLRCKVDHDMIRRDDPDLYNEVIENESKPDLYDLETNTRLPSNRLKKVAYSRRIKRRSLLQK